LDPRFVDVCPVGVGVHHITHLEQPDVVVYWAWGETMTLALILRYQEGRYTFAQREIAPGTQEPYFGPSTKGFFLHPRQTLDFADVDGDGIAEMVQTLSFAPDELEKIGYAEMAAKADERVMVCRLLKWDADEERIVQLDERLVIQTITPPRDNA
jgi:hypothetical protein